MKINRSMCVLLLCSICFLSFSCSSDEDITKEKPSEELVAKTREFLTGEIVLNSHATLNGVSKTLLETGCPTKFRFEWKNPKEDILSISLLNFTVGKMPKIISFQCDVGFMQLNSWEKDEYKGEGWVKFYGKDGSTLGDDIDKLNQQSTKGSSVKGYYNALTYEINFLVDFNMMNVRSEIFQQKIDKNRIHNFDKEFKQFEADLEQYKKDHGLS